MPVFNTCADYAPRRSTLLLGAFALVVVVFTGFALTLSGPSGRSNSASAYPAGIPFLLAIPGAAAPTPKPHVHRHATGATPPPAAHVKNPSVAAGPSAPTLRATLKPSSSPSPRASSKASSSPDGELNSEGKPHSDGESEADARCSRVRPRHPCQRLANAVCAAGGRSRCAARAHAFTNPGRHCYPEAQPAAVHHRFGAAACIEPTGVDRRRRHYMHLVCVPAREPVSD